MPSRPADHPISRRAVLTCALAAGGLLAAGAVGVETGLLSGGREDTSTERVVAGTFTSAAMGGKPTGWAIGYPPGREGARLPVLVALHGRSGDHRSAFGTGLHLDRFLAQAVSRGAAPFAIASVDGGDHSYWHPRRGSDAAGMIVEEFLPMLDARGLDVSRIGLLGWSMGGYGALYLAGVLGHRVAAAVAESPAIWHQAGRSAPGAFDDAEDFAAHAIFGHLDRLEGIALRIDCGDGDGFAPVTRDLRAALTPIPAGGLGPGRHDYPYWRSQAPAQLAFIGEHLGR